VTQTCL